MPPSGGMLGAFPEDSVTSTELMDPIAVTLAPSSSFSQPKHLGPASSVQTVPGLLNSRYGGLPSDKSASKVFESTRDGRPKPKGKPWYLGYKAGAPSSSNTDRYGFNGALEIERSRRPHNRSINFFKWNPETMGAESLRDEYAPALQGSPQIWPDKSQYVTGCRLETAEASSGYFHKAQAVGKKGWRGHIATQPIDT